MNEGWLCPRCKTVNSPIVPKCDCKNGEQKASSEDALWEMIRKAAEDQPERAPRYVPYPVYPTYPVYPWPWQQPQIVYTTDHALKVNGIPATQLGVSTTSNWIQRSNEAQEVASRCAQELTADWKPVQ